jgi:hypothetical protein
MQNSFSVLKNDNKTETIINLGDANTGSHHVHSVRTDAEGWRTACRKLAQSKTMFEVEGLCTDTVHSFFKEISESYHYEFMLRHCTMVFKPQTQDEPISIR